MQSSRIAALLEPFLERALASPQLQQISMYIDLLLRWNARMNLTAIRDPEKIVTRHFGESFFLARHLFPPLPVSGHPERSPAMGVANGSAESKTPYPSTASASLNLSFARGGITPRVIDLGSGAGFPALPLKIWAPHVQMVLVESNHKKATFLREVARTLTLTDVDVIAERAEVLSVLPSTQFPRADVVTLRAIEKFDKILPLAAAFMAPSARLALLIGSAQLPSPELLSSLNWQSRQVPKSHSRVLSIGVR
jgi:16S rRNA (guanine527-N7)-methyltransferase